MKAIEELVKDPEDYHAKLRELRPAKGNTLTVTLKIDREESRKLIEQKFLRLGFTRCPVERRINVPKCRKCWSHEHNQRECTSTEDLVNACFNCGQKGHSGEECANEHFCPVCKAKGHKAAF